MGECRQRAGGRVNCMQVIEHCTIGTGPACLGIIGLSTVLLKVHVGESLNHDGSVVKVCERLVRLTGGVPKLSFRVAGVTYLLEKVFLLCP